ncbi:UNVERIFIED_ORG: hypothetical protein M2154_000826 [Enterobacter sp. JUb101]|nr:hypothetical protein [Lelliottia amnigena]
MTTDWPPLKVTGMHMCGVTDTARSGELLLSLLQHSSEN